MYVVAFIACFFQISFITAFMIRSRCNSHTSMLHDSSKRQAASPESFSPEKDIDNITESGKGFGPPRLNSKEAKEGSSRSQKKRKYQELLKVAKSTPSLKKIVKQGVDANVATQRDRKQQSSK